MEKQSRYTGRARRRTQLWTRCARAQRDMEIVVVAGPGLNRRPSGFQEEGQTGHFPRELGILKARREDLAQN